MPLGQPVKKKVSKTGRSGQKDHANKVMDVPCAKLLMCVVVHILGNKMCLK